MHHSTFQTHVVLLPAIYTSYVCLMVVMHVFIAAHAVTGLHAGNQGSVRSHQGGRGSPGKGGKNRQMPESSSLAQGQQVACVANAVHALRHAEIVGEAPPACCLEGPTETPSCLAIQTAAVFHLLTMPQKSQQHCSKAVTLTAVPVLLARNELAHLCGL